MELSGHPAARNAPVSGQAKFEGYRPSMDWSGHPERRNAVGPSDALDSLLAQLAELRMSVPDAQLIEEAVAINHARVDEKTASRYRDHLLHFAGYLATATAPTPDTPPASFYTAKRKHVTLFLRHLEKHGGEMPHPLRLPCGWCNAHGYPDGRSGSGWSPSYRKSHLSALRFLYKHFALEEDLPDMDPTSHVESPFVPTVRQYTPSSEDIRKLLDAPGRPRDRVQAYWQFYAPSRRQTFVETRWRDLDLDAGLWYIDRGKGNSPDCFQLHPVLARELRRWRRYVFEVFAVKRRAVRDALADPERSFVLLTYNGQPVRGQTISKQLKWRAQRAGVAVQATSAKYDAPGGQTSRVSPHAMRRGWADIALNEQGVPLDVVAEVLNHKDISTTRRHYARTKPERARAALTAMRL